MLKIRKYQHVQKIWPIKFRFCLNYRVKYHDYIVKWCSGVALIGVYRWILG